VIARVTTLRVKTDKLDEVKKYYDDGIVPVVNQKKGFQAAICSPTVKPAIV
jgi:hypothetical protein